MSYGLTFDQVNATRHPAAKSMPWGSLKACAEMPQYALYHIKLRPGAVQPLHFHTFGTGKIFIESGDVLGRRLDAQGHMHAGMLTAGQTLPLAAFEVHALASKNGADAYLFAPGTEGDLQFMQVETQDQAEKSTAGYYASKLAPVGQPTTDVREKYWGRIETVLDGDVAGKRLFMKKGGQGSLEFHVHKRETYWVHSGRLKVGLRIGRAENRSIVLEAGESYDIVPGVMHMRIALEDTVIIEAGTRDSDANSYLVEDGQTYRHIEKA